MSTKSEKPFYSIKAQTPTIAEVWIYEQIGEHWWSEGITAKKFCQDLTDLKCDTINLHINSPGGSVFDGQAIYNSLVRHPATVNVYIDGLAASIASVIALAGDKIIMGDNALYMIHNPWGATQGTAEEMRKCADVLDKCKDTIVNVYAKRCNLSAADIIAAMDAETWYSATEALAAGFIDEVGATMAPANLKQFNFQALGFRRPPQAATIEIEIDTDPPPETEDCTEQDCYCTGALPEMPCPDCTAEATCINPQKNSAAPTQAPEAETVEAVMQQTTQTAPVNGATDAAAIVTMCVQNGQADKAAEYITAGLTADQVGRKILEAKATAPIITPAVENSGAQRIQVRERYNPKSLKPFASFGGRQEQERAAFEAGMWARAAIFGDPKALGWCRDLGLNMNPQAAMVESVGSTGGYLVPDSLEQAIIDLRLMYGAARALCKVIPMGTAGSSIPVHVSGTTAYFQGDKATMVESEQGWGQIELVAKNLNALTKISNNLLEDAIIDVAASVAEDHANAFAMKEDACMVIGDGTSTYGGIVGLNTLFEADSTLKSRITAATNTDLFSEIITGELASVMGNLQRNFRRNAAWLASSVADDAIFTRLLTAAGGNSTLTLTGAIAQAYAGKPREINEYMPSDPAADLTGKVMALYGDFSRACIIGDRRGIIFQVLREKYADENMTGVIGTERIDMNFRYAVGSSSKPGPVIALIGG